MVIDKVIVMDVVSGLADRSNEFANFFDCFQEIWCDMCLHFSYHTPNKTKLANDIVPNKDI